MGSAWNGLTQPWSTEEIGERTAKCSEDGGPAGVGWGGLLSPALSLERTPGGNTRSRVLLSGLKWRGRLYPN